MSATNAAGDDPFLRSMDPLRGALRVHCYRMLGSSSDSDDIMQEVLIRAWRAKDTLSDPGLMKPWLYRIATNACLDELRQRPRRGLASDFAAAAQDPRGAIPQGSDEPVWLEPMPNAWLDGAELDPASRFTLKESVALAFVAAIHALSAVQRATLLLRDVVGFSAEEAAEALGMTVSAANSALFRARSAVEEKLGRDPAAPRSEVDEALLARYIKAWENADVKALVALLRDDIETTMPPSPMWIAGRAAHEAFFAQMFAMHHPSTRARYVRIAGANGQPAFACYSAAAGGAHVLAAVHVIDVEDGAVRSIHHFMVPASFGVFGLPAELVAQ